MGKNPRLFVLGFPLWLLTGGFGRVETNLLTNVIIPGAIRVDATCEHIHLAWGMTSPIGNIFF